jgi:hypothetical protein
VEKLATDGTDLTDFHCLAIGNFKNLKLAKKAKNFLKNLAICANSFSFVETNKNK